jgi:hypothetical protein
MGIISLRLGIGKKKALDQGKVQEPSERVVPQKGSFYFYLKSF